MKNKFLFLVCVFSIFFLIDRAFAQVIQSSLTITVSAVVPSTSTPPENPPSNSGGGGGGGGGGFTVPAVNPTGSATVTFSGYAYPLSTVVLLENGNRAAITVAGPDARFTIAVSNLSQGSYVFSLYGQDSQGSRSTLFTVPVSLTDGVSTDIGGIFITPTLSADKSEVKQGDVITFFGQTIPNSPVTINVHSNAITRTTTTNSAGVYRYDLDTSVLEYGSHNATSRVASTSQISGLSTLVGFTVGDRDLARKQSSSPPAFVDLNGDGKVDIVDFSILAFWYGKPNPPAFVDLNGDGKVDLRDFSILAYYWTGS